ncbi:MAG: hypothetical protein LBH05_03965 [Deferribacteraceae bacterium]|jgi:hypothetical protein|nr:hypothetical protein [Deferribacteraceae bacterium]
MSEMMVPCCICGKPHKNQINSTEHKLSVALKVCSVKCAKIAKQYFNDGTITKEDILRMLENNEEIDIDKLIKNGKC